MSLKDTGAWMLGKMLCHPIETVVYGAMAAIVLGLSGQSCYQSVKESRELRDEFRVEAAEPSRLESPESLHRTVYMHEWAPIDVTERIKAGMERLEDKLLLEPQTSRHEPLQDSVSPNGKWWASMCARGESGGQYLAKHLIRSKGPFDYEVDTWLLFDRENSRIYAMSWEDEKMVGFPGKDFYVSAGIIPPTLPQVADNGTVAYSINSDEIPAHQRGGRPSQARVIADISGNRKYVIPVISWSAEFYPSVKLAGDGSSARIQSKHYENRHFVLDIKGGTLTEKRE